jgi:sugar lactone lactonase YvrE
MTSNLTINKGKKTRTAESTSISWWNWIISFFWSFKFSQHPKMPEIKKWTVTEPYLDIHCALGEGPYYEAERNTLRFVDIIKKRLHTVDLGIGPTSLKTLQLDMPIGVTADIEGVDSSKKILIGGKSGIYVLERETGKYELLKKYYDDEEKDERLRSNGNGYE